MANELVTLITGTRKGIGKYLAHYYVEKGHRVVGCSRSRADWELDGYTHHCADVAAPGAARAIVSDTRRRYGRLDILINNAGIASMNHSMLTPDHTLRSILDTNVRGTFHFCREAARLMKSGGRRRIVNFTTVATPLKLEGEAAYAASKAAVLSLTEVLAREYAPMGITVNAVGPTPVMTDLIRSVPKEKIDRLLDRQAIPRLGTNEDIANVIDFYIREESEFITGQNIYLGGV